VTRDEAGTGERDPGELVGLIARDAERLIGQHFDLLRSELRQDVREVRSAVASMGAGAGLVATGGVLGSLMLVHGLHRSTRLPLWGCYGLVGGLLTALGAGLVATGAQRAAGLRLVPRETIAALREDVEWIKDLANPEAS
jgi:hypothetical protein